jgi:hypothetical protein
MSKTNGFNGDTVGTSTGERSILRAPNPAEKSIDQRASLAPGERELLNEVEQAVRAIHYGSIVLTIHEGRLVEISKTIRLRNPPVRSE